MLFFGAYIYLEIIYNNVILIDDLSLFRTVYDLQDRPESFFPFIIKFISSDVMNARPVSGFVSGCIIYISQYYSRFYFISYFFFFLATYSVFKLLKEYYKNFSLAIIGATLFGLIPIASVIQFSPIMLNANLSVFFYCYSLIFLMKHTTKSYLISSLLFTLSFLSYEIFLPFIIINVILINKEKISFKNIMISISPVLVFIFYKNIIAPLIFVNANHRETPGNIFEIKRNLEIIQFAAKAYFIDLPVSIKKGLLGIQYFSVLDFIILTIFILANIIFFRNISFEVRNFNKIKSFFLIIILFLIANSIYVFSEYTPRFFDFDNRTMAGVRLVSVILFINAVLLSKFPKIITLISLIFLGIFSLSSKNAWNYANEFNNKMFSQLKNKLPKKHYKNVFIFYDYYTEKKFNPHFVMREPIYSNHYETYSLCKRNNIIPFYGKPFYSKDKIKEVSKAKKDPDFTRFPYLIFDKSKNKIFLINNLNDYVSFFNS